MRNEPQRDMWCQNLLDSVGGGAWPFLVREVTRLVNSDNERDLNLLNSPASFRWSPAS